MTTLVFIIAGLVGLFIGATGIGGVALAPLFESFGDWPLEQAIATGLACFAGSGIVAGIVYARAGNLDYSLALPLSIAAVPGSALGSFLLPYTPKPILIIAMSALMLYTAWTCLRPTKAPTSSSSDSASPKPPTLLALGALTGMLSALVGVGGPVILIPMLLLLGIAPLIAIGASLTIQIPVGATASLVNYATGTLDLERTLPIAAILVTGTIIGAIAAQKLPTKAITTALGVLLFIFPLYWLYAERHTLWPL